MTSPGSPARAPAPPSTGKAGLPEFPLSPLVAVTMVVLVLFVAITWILVHLSAQQAVAHEKKLLETFSISLAEHVEQAVKRGDQLLQQNRDLFLRNPSGLREQLERNNRVVDRRDFPLEAVIRSDGRMLISTTSSGTTSDPVDLSDREHFRFHADQVAPFHDDIFIGRIIVGRVSRLPVMQISRAIRDPNGHLLGVGVVSLNPDEFIAPYRQMVTSNFTITLFGEDRIGRMRITREGAQYSMDYSRSETVSAMLLSPRGSVEAVSTVDGVRRLYGYSKVKDLPLYVAIGSAINDIQGGSLSASTTLNYVAGMLLVSLLALLLAALWSQRLTLRLANINHALTHNIREMEMSSLAQRQMVTSISHELRTPLHGIAGHAQLLTLDMTADDPRRESAEAILKSAIDLRSIVGQLLDLGRAEAGKEVLRIETVNLTELIHEVSLLHQAAAERSGLQFRVKVEVPELTIHTDPIALKRCLHNLLSNAIKFTPHGSVEVEVMPGPDASVRIAVRDTGIGIPSDHMDKVFDYYSYLSQISKSTVAGTGLGLALCQRLVRQLGGDISVQSREGSGSEFVITLPIGSAGGPKVGSDDGPASAQAAMAPHSPGHS